MDDHAPHPEDHGGPGRARLAELRAQIDDTDRKLLRLLDQRIEYALQTARLKPAVTDSGREDDVLNRVRAAACGLLSEDFVGEPLRRDHRREQAAPGAPPAVRRLPGRTRRLERDGARPLGPDAWCPSPAAASPTSSTASSSGAFDRGIVPVENSLGGAVNEVTRPADRDAACPSSAKCACRCSQCLLALPGTALADIRSVRSHPAGARPVPRVPGPARHHRRAPITTRPARRAG